ncbi:MAG TPA: metallophosphoesterase [Lachnospiraceae bacterium]|nr:metallophosphoesterase [Lachnospiraceae bacterium]
MRILAVSDTEEKAIWDYFDRERLGEIDLIISCGDLSPGYLDFLQSMLNVPLLYVKGNHDRIYSENPPPGGICIDGMVHDFEGLRIAGLGGSMSCVNAPLTFTEKEMNQRFRRLIPKIEFMNGLDLLVTHSPVLGYGDMEDLPHRGFKVFDDMLKRYHPRVMLHGHVHKQYGHFVREREHPSGTRIINASGYYVLELCRDEYPRRGKTGSFLYDMVISMKDGLSNSG